MGAIAAIVGLAGGLGLFIYGIQICSEGLQKLAAHRLKQLVKFLTNNPMLGLLIGILVTIGLQSSGATSALVVGFVGANLMTLSQALGIFLGSAIGASLTAQIIAFKITGFALFLLFIGAVLYIFSKRSRQRSLGQTILGFGLLFYGIFVMTSAMAPVKDIPVMVRILVDLERYPIMEFGLALIITAIIQSSPAFLALLMSLAAHHLVGPQSIIPFVLGAHLGGTITGMLSCIGTAGRDAKRAAIANFVYKLINGLVFLPFYKPLTRLMVFSSPGDISREIANIHTFFSLVMAVGFLPFTKPVAELMKRLIPDKRAGLGEALFLDENLLEFPEVAVDQAQHQTLEMGRIVSDEMLARALPVLRYSNDQITDHIDRVERAIDELYKKISRFLTRLGTGGLSDQLMQRSIEILYVANDLEHVGDIMSNVARQARKISAEAIGFSEEGMEELENMYQLVFEHFRLALKAFETTDQILATRVIKEHPRILKLEKELRYSHFDRMHGGNQKTIATSSIHLDLIESMLRIDGHAVNIAQVVLGIV
jgi:phosphate:Na+ symporter